MSLVYKVKCSLMFLVGNNNTGALKDYPIFHCYIFPEGPIGLDFTWNFSEDATPSLHDCVLEYSKLISFLGCYSYINQAVTSCIQLTCNLMNVQLLELDGIFLTT